MQPESLTLKSESELLLDLDGYLLQFFFFELLPVHVPQAQAQS